MKAKFIFVRKHLTNHNKLLTKINKVMGIETIMRFKLIEESYMIENSLPNTFLFTKIEKLNFIVF